MSRVTHLLNKVVTIRRKTRTADAQGFIEVEADLATSIKARISPASGNERLIAAQKGADVTHAGYFEPTQDIKRGDIVVENSDRFEVLFVLDPSKVHHRKVVMRISQEGP